MKKSDERMWESLDRYITNLEKKNKLLEDKINSIEETIDDISLQIMLSNFMDENITTEDITKYMERFEELKTMITK